MSRSPFFADQDRPGSDVLARLTRLRGGHPVDRPGKQILRHALPEWCGRKPATAPVLLREQSTRPSCQCANGVRNAHGELEQAVAQQFCAVSSMVPAMRAFSRTIIPTINPCSSRIASRSCWADKPERPLHRLGSKRWRVELRYFDRSLPLLLATAGKSCRSLPTSRPFRALISGSASSSLAGASEFRDRARSTMRRNRTAHCTEFLRSPAPGIRFASSTRPAPPCASLYGRG